MRRTPLSLIAQWAGGDLHGEDLAVDAVSNDSRTLTVGSLYVALRGERFDGHDFAATAVDNGAVALLVERMLDLPVPQVVVADSLAALARLAAGMQQGRAATVIALTGSNGKTTVKTLVLEILRRYGHTDANPGNRNNEVGLPLAVIDAQEHAQFAVYEMGAGKPGDIAYLTAIVRPDVALVNNIAAAHLERLGTLLGVAQAKSAIYHALPEHGVAVINADDAFAQWFTAQVPGRRVIRFGLEADAEVTARALVTHSHGSCFTLVTMHGEVEIQLALPGRHNVSNALAAAALALGCGVPLALVAEGLAAARPVAGRQVAHALVGGGTLVDDSYNANPDSLAAAIDTLAASRGVAWLVLGDMRELGPQASALHVAAGKRARDRAITRLYTLGELARQAANAFGEHARTFDSHQALSAALRADLAQASDPPTVLVKGSRGSAMDQIVRALLDGHGTQKEGAAHAA